MSNRMESKEAMSSEDQVGNPAPLFIIGAPRSGTSWLQMLLGEHPGIATCPETHLFSSYLGGMFRAWKGHTEAPRAIGLCTLMSEPEFQAELRDFALRTLRRIHARKPTASVALEKTPAHVNYWRNIDALFPEARFIHLVRDPRNVVASLRRAGQGWGRRWAAPGVVANSRRWLRDVESGLAAESELGARCRQIRYEVLSDDTVCTLLEILRWLDLPTERASVEAYVESCDLDRLRKGASKAVEPQGFFGAGHAHADQADLTLSQRHTVEWIAGTMMARLGYQLVGRSRQYPPASAVAADIADRLNWRWVRWRTRL